VKRVVKLVGNVEEALDQDEPEADPCRHLRVAAADQLLGLRQLADELFGSHAPDGDDE
jgi:hypothetical protein